MNEIWKVLLAYYIEFLKYILKYLVILLNYKVGIGIEKSKVYFIK